MLGIENGVLKEQYSEDSLYSFSYIIMCLESWFTAGRAKSGRICSPTRVTNFVLVFLFAIITKEVFLCFVPPPKQLYSTNNIPFL